jgi:hypothetical protein
MPRKNITLYAALCLSAFLAGLNQLAYARFLYWTYWWYDVMMHFLAGVALGFLVYWVLFASAHFFTSPKRRAFVLAWVIVPVFALGVAWEVFEYANGITDSHEGYAQDTVNDLILDTCGAALAALMATSRRGRSYAAHSR